MKKTFFAFTLIDLLVIIAIIAGLAAILFPVFAQAKAAAKKTACLSNTKNISTSCQIYVSDSDDKFPASSFNDIYGDYHPWEKIYSPGGNFQSLLPDSLFPYVKSSEVFTCPTLKFEAQQGNSGKFVSSGSFAYMCSHSRTNILGKTTSPLRVLLHFFKLNTSKSDDEMADEISPCHRELTSFDSPETQPLLMCDSLGIHLPNGIEWEKNFFPADFGGESKNGGVGATNMAFADGHAKYVGGSFQVMLQKLKIR